MELLKKLIYVYLYVQILLRKFLGKSKIDYNGHIMHFIGSMKKIVACTYHLIYFLRFSAKSRFLSSVIFQRGMIQNFI